MDNLPLYLTIIIFILAGAVTWIAGVTLAKATDTLDTRYKIGDALGGLILLGIAGSLPEIAVVYSAAISGRYSVILGNLIGGISIQTLIIVIFDFAVKKKKPLSYLSGSMLMSLESLFAIGVTIIAIFGMIIPTKFSVFHASPFSIGILIAWILGLLLINKERKLQRFNETAVDAQPGRKHHEKRAVIRHGNHVDTRGIKEIPLRQLRIAQGVVKQGIVAKRVYDLFITLWIIVGGMNIQAAVFQFRQQAV